MHPDSDHDLEREPERVEHFAYFMIRVRRTSLSKLECSPSGMVEQLATGEKESFASGEELIRIVCRIAEAERKVATDTTESNG